MSTCSALTQPVLKYSGPDAVVAHFPLCLLQRLEFYSIHQTVSAHLTPLLFSLLALLGRLDSSVCREPWLELEPLRDFVVLDASDYSVSYVLNSFV